jgi:hypothetical protein
VHANASSCLSCCISGSTLQPACGELLVPDSLPSVPAEALQLELACSWPVAPPGGPPLLVSCLVDERVHQIKGCIEKDLNTGTFRSIQLANTPLFCSLFC